MERADTKPDSLQDNLPVLEVKNLRVQFSSDSGTTTAVVDESFVIHKGETLALVGESGSGKSVTSLSVMRLVEHGGGKIVNGSIHLRCRDGRLVDLMKASRSELQALRGSEVAMIFQEPMTSLNPVFTVGAQIAESLTLHRGMSEAEALKEAVRLLELVRIPDAERVAMRYPHQLSGGMRQRVMIAIALACKPQLLIADEPTTALDVTVQAQILALIAELQKEIGMAVLFITHDMGVVAQIADRVAVMRYGEIVEEGKAVDIFDSPKHPYTQALLSAVPRLGSLKDVPHPCFFRLIDPDNGRVIEPPSDKLPPPGDTILEVNDIVKTFPVRTDFWGKPTYVVRACDHVSFKLRQGETLSIVGESGCGKSTTGRALLRLLDIDSGDIIYRDRSLVHMTRRDLQHARRDLQMIFQDPYASLDPRQTVGYSIAEPLMIHNICSKSEMWDRVAMLLKRVGLSPDMANRYPHEFSGGQRQRIGIARALVMEPEFIVADEPISALDVSIRAQVLNLLNSMKKSRGLTYLFIAHDLSVVRFISDRIAVISKGRIVELAEAEELFLHPLHPYTKALLSAVPIPDPALEKNKKLLVYDPSIHDYSVEKPVWEEIANGHFVYGNQRELEGYRKEYESQL